jgi:hypothetical protein
MLFETAVRNKTPFSEKKQDFEHHDSTSSGRV